MSEAGAGTTAPWAQKYPPLAAMAVGLLIALVVLPSALNLPQTNPTETLEYAPVPPEDDEESPPDGNFAALGLGSSSSVKGEGAPGGEGPGGTVPTESEPIDPDVACVGTPPRQTADPLSPPCVPSWDEADNGGETYKGVTATEVRLLITIDGGINYVSSADRTSGSVAPTNTIYDLGLPASYYTDQGDTGINHLTARGLRVWQQYFNARFQTYGRFVRFFVAYSEGTGATPERRRGEAAQHLAAVDPFAVISFYSEGAEDAYLEAMARKGVLNFGSFGLRTANFFQTYPARIWSYLPSVEQQAQTYTSYICQKVVNQPAVLAGGPLNGQPRKLGMIHTTNTRTHPGLVAFAEIVKQKVAECGGVIADTATFENCCLASDNGDAPDEESSQMARFASQGITTILWPGGGNGNYARSLSAGYEPEWILAGGDGFMDNEAFAWYSNSGAAFDDRAVVVSPRPLQPGLEQQRCYQFYREFDQDTHRDDMGYICEFYDNLFQFFVGVQVAGPYLGPTQIDKGFHAIPQKYDGQPTVPACFYLPGDYTCIKDAAAYRFSLEHRRPGSSRTGCWRAVDGGRRHAPGQWPAGNVDAQFTDEDPCTGYNESVRTNTT